MLRGNDQQRLEGLVQHSRLNKITASNEIAMILTSKAYRMKSTES